MAKEFWNLSNTLFSSLAKLVAGDVGIVEALTYSVIIGNDVSCKHTLFIQMQNSCCLQNEIIAHAETTTKLMESQDKLEFALGEIEMLQKQIEREKRQFEET